MRRPPRSRTLTALLCALAPGAGLPLFPAVCSAATLHLVDDRQERIEAPLEVCVVLALERTCFSSAEGEAEIPPKLDFLTVEGEDHGPVTLAREDLEWSDDGSVQGQVPRKAVLTFEALPEAGARLELYRADDPVFRKPVLGTSVADGETVKVGVGRVLLALTAKGFAPDLREIDLQPAQKTEIELRRRPGGSLVLRTTMDDLQGRGSELPVSEATIELRTSSLDLSPEATPEVLRRTSTSSSGLALVSGIELPIVDAVVEHAGFLSATVPALALAPGTFGFREIALHRGGALVAQVTLDGLPLPGAKCTLLLYDRVPGGDAAPAELWTGRTDPQGVCRGEGLRAGERILRVEAPGSGRQERRIDVPVEIVESRVADVAAALERVTLEGHVFRGKDPASGYRVVVHDLEARKPDARDQDAAALVTADEEGQYRVTLWRTGEYFLEIQNPRGTPSRGERVELEAGSQERDFHLGTLDIAGRVVDARQRPIPGARVLLTWQGASTADRSNMIAASADEVGEFSFALMEDSGSALVSARAEGYFPSEPIEVEVQESREPQTLVLVLKSDGSLRGQLLGPRGPVAGGKVITYRSDPLEPSRWLGETTTDGQGYFRVPQAESEAVRVFFTGPGCPLGSAAPPRALAGSGGGRGDAPEEVWPIACASASAAVELVVRNPDGSPRPRSGVLVVQQGLAFPFEVLSRHLARAGLPWVSDAEGRLLLAGLEPGSYDLYLAEASSPANLRLGSRRGYLGTVQLVPGALRTVEARLQEEIPPRGR